MQQITHGNLLRHKFRCFTSPRKHLRRDLCSTLSRNSWYFTENVRRPGSCTSGTNLPYARYHRCAHGKVYHDFGLSRSIVSILRRWTLGHALGRRIWLTGFTERLFNRRREFDIVFRFSQHRIRAGFAVALEFPGSHPRRAVQLGPLCRARYQFGAGTNYFRPGEARSIFVKPASRERKRPARRSSADRFRHERWPFRIAGSRMARRQLASRRGTNPGDPVEFSNRL